MATDKISPNNGEGNSNRLTFNIGRNTSRQTRTFTLNLSADNQELTSNNSIIISQAAISLFNVVKAGTSPTATIAYEATGNNRIVEFRGVTNAKMLQIKAPSESGISSAIGFQAFESFEYSAGSSTGATISSSLTEVNSFIGGSQQYEYAITIPVPVGQSAGNYGVTVVAADSESSQSIPLTFYVTVSAAAYNNVTIHAIYKSSDSSAEELSTDLSWKEDGNTATLIDGIDVQTVSGANTYAYTTYGILPIGASVNTLKLKVSASMVESTKVVTNTASVYASNEETLPSYITGGSFVDDGVALNNISVADDISQATEYAINLSNVRQSLNQSEPGPIHIYILFTAAEVVPVYPTIQQEQIQIGVNSLTSEITGNIGYNVAVTNGSTAGTYKTRIALVYTGDPAEVEFASGVETGTADGGTYAVLGSNMPSGTYIQSLGSFSLAAPVTNSSLRIPISSILTVSGEEFTDAEILQFLLDKMELGEVSFKIDLLLNDAQFANHPIDIGASSSYLVRINEN